MKKFLAACLITFFSGLAFSQGSLTQVIKAFDEDFMNAQSTTAQVTLGFITYEDSNTCGTIVPYLQSEIKSAVENTRRISIVKTTELSEYEQAGIATRGLSMGMSANAKKAGEKKYILDGKYYDKGSYIELALSMHDADGNVFAKKTASIDKSIIDEFNLTLYPENKKIAETIQTDFDKTENEQKKSSKSSVAIAASMLDSSGSLVNILHPNDIVRFKISTDTDCYIAILCIDADGIKTWLPTTNNYMEADKPRMFPDISGAVLKVDNNGVYGAEQVIIYACTNEAGLPNQNDNGKYSNQDLHLIMKKQQSAKENKSYQTGTFKITYTVMEK